MKIKVYLIFIMFIFSLDVYGQLKIEINNVREEWLLGEPIRIGIYLKNESKGILRTYRSLMRFSSASSLKLYISPMEGVEKMSERTEEEIINQIYEYEPLWEYRREIGLFDYIIKKAGIYRVKVVYDVRMEGSNYVDKGVYLGPSESNEIEIKVKEPAGIDLEAYNYFKGFPIAYGEELLEKYPTSTYAGWALINRGSGASPNFATGKELLDDLLLPYNQRKGFQGRLDDRYKDKSKWLTPEDIAEEYERYAEAYLSLHSEEDLSLIIYMRLAMAKAALGKWQESYEAAEKSLAKEWPKWYINQAPRIVEGWRKILIEYKDELIKRGFAKRSN
jgi:hypothetical protein